MLRLLPRIRERRGDRGTSGETRDGLMFRPLSRDRRAGRIRFHQLALCFTPRMRPVGADNTDAFEPGNKNQNQRPLLRQLRDRSVK